MLKFSDKLPRSLDRPIEHALRETQRLLGENQAANLRQFIPELATTFEALPAGARWLGVVHWTLLGVSGTWRVSRNETKPADERNNPQERFRTRENAEQAAERFARRMERLWKDFYIERYKLTRIGATRGAMPDDERIRPKFRTGKALRRNNARGV